MSKLYENFATRVQPELMKQLAKVAETVGMKPEWLAAEWVVQGFPTPKHGEEIELSANDWAYLIACAGDSGNTFDVHYGMSEDCRYHTPKWCWYCEDRSEVTTYEV